MTWKDTDPQGNEAGKIKWEIVRWTRGRGLDIGAGLYRTFPQFITVDNNIDQILFGHPMPRPDYQVEDAGTLDMIASASMDFVFSSHLLEHVEPERLVKVLNEWWRVVKKDGYLILYLPDADEYPLVGTAGANPDHKWNVTYNEVLRLMQLTESGFDLMDYQKRNEEQEYSLYFVFQKKAKTPKAWHHDRPRSIAKTCGLVRYGAIGDMMQAASVIAALKEQGYHVTLYCAEGNGYDTIKGDPHVDDFYIQGRGQVPDAWLGPFWKYHSAKYDKWVNLCESVEGGLLVMTDRPVDTYSAAVRHELLDWNYVDRQHLIAGVPDAPHRIHFYATPEERKWAKKEHDAFGSFSSSILVMWSLSGSSVHKTWPWLDNAISGMLVDFPEITVVLVGGEDGVVLEQGWEGSPRVHRRSGKYSVRESLSLAQVSDVVIGPETGVLNAVSMESMPKVVFLSHSSQENLTKHWVNTHSLASLGTHCQGRGKDEAPACHRLHHNWGRCTEAPAIPGTEKMHGRKGSGVAQCQYDISAQDAYKVIWHVIQWRLEEYAKRDGVPLPGVMTASELAATRLTLPAHLQNPAAVIEEAQQKQQKSVIEA
jgi:predicted SAM-dependent methyltransferase/ADP-heptose:LPS heptosyltransferase